MGDCRSSTYRWRHSLHKSEGARGRPPPWHPPSPSMVKTFKYLVNRWQLDNTIVLCACTMYCYQLYLRNTDIILSVVSVTNNRNIEKLIAKTESYKLLPFSTKLDITLWSVKKILKEKLARLLPTDLDVIKICHGRDLILFFLYTVF